MTDNRKQVWPTTDRLRVLIADDNRDAADSLAFLVRIWGHDARVAYEGREALATALAFLPHVLFLDIGMPGLDGYQLCRRIRQEKKLRGAVLVALTAYSGEETLHDAVEAGFDYHLVKPVEPGRIQRLLAQAHAPGSGSPALSAKEFSGR